MLKRLFLQIEWTTYAFWLIALFSIIGALIIYFNPEGYYLISLKPLFEWLYLNRRFDTFWLYLIIILFAYTAITGLICLIRDLRNFKILPFIFHLSFLLILLSHLLSAKESFKIKDIILPHSKPEIVTTAPPFRPLKLFLRDLTYQNTPFGIPTDIKAQLIYLEGKQEKEGTLAINHPLKIENFYVILKDVGSFLRAVNFRISDGKKDEYIQLVIGEPFIRDNYKLEFLAHDEAFTQIKISYYEGEKKETLYLTPGNNLRLGDKTYKVLGFSPVVVPAIIVDISYDPSIILIFYASTIFTLALIIDAIRRFFTFFRSAI